MHLDTLLAELAVTAEQRCELRRQATLLLRAGRARRRGGWRAAAGHRAVAAVHHSGGTWHDHAASHHRGALAHHAPRARHELLLCAEEVGGALAARAGRRGEATGLHLHLGVGQAVGTLVAGEGEG